MRSRLQARYTAYTLKGVSFIWDAEQHNSLDIIELTVRTEASRMSSLRVAYEEVNIVLQQSVEEMNWKSLRESCPLACILCVNHEAACRTTTMYGKTLEQIAGIVTNIIIPI